MVKKISNTGSGLLFRNQWLERLTRTHFLFPVILYYVLSLAMILLAVFKVNQSITSLVVLFVSGMIAFTLIEYLIHRFLFHFPATTPRQKRLQYLIHGVHHEFPKDKDRLVMPPVLSILLAVLFYSLFRLLLKDNAFAFFAGFSAGYSTYLLIHYSVHRFRPPRNLLKILWKHHALHHYREEEGNYSVSLPVWDMVFGSTIRLTSERNNEEILNRL
jgi:sterol desaturase/sphingolipid hydroxylase (fatty acid hydroxylase superfamily)